MNPTSNKRDFEDLTTNLKDLAYSYLKNIALKTTIKNLLIEKYLTKLRAQNQRGSVFNNWWNFKKSWTK